MRSRSTAWLGLVPTTLGLRIALFLALALWAALPMLAQGVGMNTFHDAQFLSAYERNARLSVLEYGELPLWDPYSCGGMYGLAGPQTRYASPLFLLTLALGVDTAAGLQAVLLMAFCMEGAFRYARSWGASAFAALLCAPIFPLSGFFGMSFRFGWLQFFSLAFLPWLLWSFRGLVRGQRVAVVQFPVLVALTLGIGGTYTLPMAAIPMLCDALTLLAPRLRQLLGGGFAPALKHSLRRSRIALVAVSSTLPLVLGVSAYRLWPMLESLEATLRVMGGVPVISLQNALAFLFEPCSTAHPGGGHFYVGPVVVLALFAALRGSRGPYLAALLGFGLALGHFDSYAPFSLLRHLPIYDTLRYPERYLLISGLALAVLSALGVTQLRARLRRFGPRATLVFSLFLCIFAGIGVALEVHNLAAQTELVTLEPSPGRTDAPFRQSRGNRWLMSHFAAENLGSLGCGEAYPVPMSQRLRGDLAAEEYLVTSAGEAAQGSVERRAWSPNALRLHVRSSAPVRLAINQNFHPGWHSDVGAVASWDGLLSVMLPAGEQDVSLRFQPRSATAGFWVSLLSLSCALIYSLRPRLPLAHRCMLLVAGPVLGLGMALAWPEAPLVRPPALTEDLTPVLLPRVPEGAATLAAEFAVPLVLEAASMPNQASGSDAAGVPLTLYLRRTGKLSAELGLFVHLLGPRGAAVHADHPELSSVVYLPRMPEGVVVRDAFRVALPAHAVGTWQVRVGLWNAYGDGKRVPLRHRGRAGEDDGSVRLPDFELVP